MSKIFTKTILALTLSASCSIASAALFNISEVLDGVDDSFKFSGIHFAGVDTTSGASSKDSDNDPMTGTQITRFLSTPVSGTYDDVSGAINLVLSLDPDNFNAGGISFGDDAYVDPGFVTFSGNMFFEPTLNPASSLTTVFSDEFMDIDGLLENTTMLFSAGLVDCCEGASQRPNTFDGTTMSLWGANFGSTSGDGTLGLNEATLGLDLRIVLTSVVPVPAAVWLFGSGLLGLAAVARRKSA